MPGGTTAINKNTATNIYDPCQQPAHARLMNSAKTDSSPWQVAPLSRLR